MPKRPSIPAEIQRQIFFESGYRCAVCGASLPLERAHIIPWHKSREHKAEDLICLCANCHERADQEDWGEKILRDFKQKPWVMRNFEKSNDLPEPRTEVELVINMELHQFDERQKILLQFALAYLLEISANAIRIISVKKSNSVTVTVELPAESALELLNAYQSEDAQLLSCLASFGLISISTSKVTQSGKDYSSYFRGMSRWVSYPALLTAALTFLFGVKFAEIIHPIGIRLAEMLHTIGLPTQQENQTIIEGIIALLNIVLATFVLLDIRLLRPVKTSDDNTPASKSFKQLLFGWQCLWFTWILFYFCLAAQWLQLIGKGISIIIEPVAHGLNMINGFFFYYLFFVLDQPSVPTDEKPHRAKSFHRNCLLTLSIGFILLLMFATVSLWNNSAGEQSLYKGILLPKLVPAYIAVGMAFLFGRLDSHYLRLPRVTLAPLYLYAIIQLFWERNTYAGVLNFNPDRVAVFSLALILKFVLFLTLSRLIRHESFRKYFDVAEKGLRDS